MKIFQVLYSTNKLKSIQWLRKCWQKATCSCDKPHIEKGHLALSFGGPKPQSSPRSRNFENWNMNNRKKYFPRMWTKPMNPKIKRKLKAPLYQNPEFANWILSSIWILWHWLYYHNSFGWYQTAFTLYKKSHTNIIIFFKLSLSLNTTHNIRGHKFLLLYFFFKLK